MAFRVTVEDPVVAAFQDPYTYDTIGYGDCSQFQFKDGVIEFEDISEFLKFLGVYTAITLAVVPGGYDNLRSTYKYLDGVCEINLLPDL